MWEIEDFQLDSYFSLLLHLSIKVWTSVEYEYYDAYML